MRKFDNPDVAFLRRELHKEITKSSDSRFLHRLHCLLLVSQGHSCHAVADWFGAHPRTVERWVRDALSEGLIGLADADKLGRPARIDQEMFAQLAIEIRAAPYDFGYQAKRWNGLILSLHLGDHYGIRLGVRQCQRLLKQLLAC